MDTILVIEDSREMQRALQRLFQSDSLSVQLASDGVAGLKYFRDNPPSAVVLDLNLPGMSGKDLCREFKSIAPAVPVVVVSATCETDDIVHLLQLGADDYVTKPFSPKELLARLRRAMRRAANEAHPNDAEKAAASLVLKFGDVTVNFSSMEVKCSGKSITLTAQEFKLLKFLATSPGTVYTRAELMASVWGFRNYMESRTVDNHILRLRQKLEPDPAHPRFFMTMQRFGYKFVLTGDV
jgi:DNA-binding response OmpR family regulator